MPSFRSLRGNLSSAIFPFVSDFQGRTIIIPQFDSNYDRQLNTGADPDKDKGVPQIFYMHNCMPTEAGVQSIGYELKCAAKISPAVTDFDQFLILRDTSENKALYAPAAGQNYVFTGVSNAWTSVSPLAAGAVSSNALITVAYIHKRTLVYYEKLACYEYDFIAGVFNVVAFAGLVATAIRGIASAVGYTIAFDDTTIYWSSTVTETDFVPSLVTGAGSQIPNDVKGRIISVLPIPNGFMIYSTKNVVSAFFSGNVRFPWVFREVTNSAGVNAPENIAWQANLAFQYAWTTAGLMKVDKSGAELFQPAASDFISARVFEDFDEIAKTFLTTYATSDFKTKLALIGSRYLVLSYGLSSLTHAVIYDTVLRRWGKIRIPHVDCFEWPAPNFFGTRTYAQLTPNTYSQLAGNSYIQLSMQQQITVSVRRDICFLQQNGTVQSINFDVGNAAASGVLLVGKYQFVRTNLIRLLATELENSTPTQTLAHTWFSAFDGKKFGTTTTPFKMPVVSGSLVRRYQGEVTARNHSLAVTGGFNLASFQLEFTIEGTL